jgi:hypothetical protein
MSPFCKKGKPHYINFTKKEEVLKETILIATKLSELSKWNFHYYFESSSSLFTLKRTVS